MPPSDSRSQSPPSGPPPSSSRRRSRSPRRSSQPSQRNGFRWKEQPKATKEPELSRGLERGHRSERGDGHRRRDDDRGQHQREGRTPRRVDDDSPRYSQRDGSDRASRDESRRRSRERRRSPGRAHATIPAASMDTAIASKFGLSSSSSSNPNIAASKSENSINTSMPPPATAPRRNEPMILVTVNDRLGTKAQIPCLASDPVRLFKAQVAARIGRQPHEIMLKRQGERPFKDQLTLEDYGVSSGVQLDLEVDTGD